MKFLANFVMQGPLQAFAVAGLLGVLSQFVLPLALISCGVIALCILTQSDRDSLIILVGTIFLILISGLFTTDRPGISFPLMYVLLPPVALCAKILKVSQSQSLVVLLAITFGVMLAATIQIVTGDAVQWWAAWVEVAASGVKDADIEGFARSGTLQFMNGLVAMMFSLAIISSLFIGRWMQANLFNPGAFAVEFYQIKYGLRVLMAFGVIVLLTLVIHAQLAFDFIFVFTVAFLLQGLAVLHFTVDRMKKSSSYLLPPYILMFLFPHFVIVGLASVGIVDIFLDFRNPRNKK